MKAINAIRMGGIDVLPLIEGGKGVSISNGFSSGNWAAAGGIGTLPVPCAPLSRDAHTVMPIITQCPAASSPLSVP